jgi:hypothetical protein
MVGGFSETDGCFSSQFRYTRSNGLKKLQIAASFLRHFLPAGRQARNDGLIGARNDAFGVGGLDKSFKNTS